ncbi:hypothetical protein ACHAXA_008006, partial [Cyclostephanos tholiformis]
KNKLSAEKKKKKNAMEADLWGSVNTLVGHDDEYDNDANATDAVGGVGGGMPPAPPSWVSSASSPSSWQGATTTTSGDDGGGCGETPPSHDDEDHDEGVVVEGGGGGESVGTSMRSGVAVPYRDACDAYRRASSGEYVNYLEARSRCVKSRSSALIARGYYVDKSREYENSIRSLRRAVRMSRRRDAIVGGVMRRKGRAIGGISAGSSRPTSPTNYDDDDDDDDHYDEKKKKEGGYNEDKVEEDREEKEKEEKEGEEGKGKMEKEEDDGEEEDEESTPSSSSFSTATVVGGEAANGPSSSAPTARDAVAPTSPTSSSDSPPPWEEELHKLADRFKLSRQVCETVTRLYNDVATARADYARGVLAENEAVEEVQALERMALDCLQRLEEASGPIFNGAERITLLVGLTDRLLCDEKRSLEEMSLDLTPEALEPLDYLADCSGSGNNNKEQPPIISSITTSPQTSPTPSSLFLTARRRAQSDDGPAINETRLLELPDKMAEIRERMKSLVGRQTSRLKTLKMISSFNEDMASTIECFASGIKSRLEIGLALSGDRSSQSDKNEVASVLNSWNSAVRSLEMYANNAEVLAKQIRRGNIELQSAIMGSAEKEAKSFHDREECRWKSLCDAARVETKAKAKLKQHVAELEKAKARVMLAEDGDSKADGAGNNNATPRRSAQSTKIDRHVNKAMGKMFSILPGGGEDVMNKVLTPMQRQAISKRQLDEARVKEGKGTESYEIACAMKQQAVVSYEAEAEGAEFKFKCYERNDLDLMQKSLISTVEAMRKFRERQLQSVLSSIATKLDQRGKGNFSDDMTGWVTFIEKRLKDHRTRIVDYTKVDESDVQAEIRFSLMFKLVACTDVQETIRQLLDDENGAMDDIDICKEEEGSYEIVEKMSLLPDVPPDLLIKKMDLIFSKTLKNVTIEDYYNHGWSEERPLYGPWLEKKGSFDVSVGNWEHSTEGFENPWSGEKFPQKRVIRFKFNRTTHLYIGPPVAGVTQTQYLIKEGNDKCIVMTTVDIDGVPYSDVFAVEVRWAARRIRENSVAIDAGVFVRFLKSSIGVLKETPPVHHDLFEVIKNAISSSDDREAISEVDLKQPLLIDANKVNSDAVEAETEIFTIPSKFEGIYRLIIAVFSLAPTQQLALSVAIFLLARVIFSKNDPSAVDDLAQKVNELTIELREVKDLLERILIASERNSLKFGDMGGQ